MAYTLGQAARATGKSKTTILRAIEKGKISAERNEHNEWVIEPAELHRVYEPTDQGNGSEEQDAERYATDEGTGGNTLLLLANRELKAKLEATQARLHDAQDQIDDLRRRLDAEGEERRALTRVLTDQRTKEEMQPVQWWKRLMGKSRR